MLTVTARFRDVMIDHRFFPEAAARARSRVPARYRIGSAPGVAAPAPLVADEAPDVTDFTLLEERDGEVLVQVTPSMSGHVEVDGARTPLVAWVARDGAVFALPDGASAQITCGDMTFLVSDSEPPPQLPRPWFPRPRWAEQKYTLGSALGLGLLLAVAMLVPPDAKALTGDRLSSDPRFIAFRVIPPEPPPVREFGGGRAAGAGVVPAVRPAPRVRKPPRRQVNPVAAALGGGAGVNVANVGVLPMLAEHAGKPIAQLIGKHDLLDPNFEAHVLRGLQAGPPGSGYYDTISGLGLPGTGTGGPGGTGMLGRPVLDTIGGCTGGGPCTGENRYGTGVDGLHDRRHVARAPEVAIGTPVVRGSLDKEIIRRIIRRHINEVRFCYEQALARDPSLHGRVAVSFTIAASGIVTAAVLASSTIGHAGVESCVVAAVRRWDFPQPAGGGMVIATYPFNFVSAGGAP